MRRFPEPRPTPAAAFIRRLVTPLAVAALLLAAGCQSAPKVRVDWKGGPFFAPTNHTGLAEMPRDVRRVAILPLAGLEGVASESVAALVAAQQAALAKAGRFEVVVVPAERLVGVAGRPAVGSAEAMPPALFEMLAREYAADAVLFTDVTVFRPYLPLALGLRAKLARCGGGHEILWAIDTIYDARNQAVANTAIRYADGSGAGAGGPPEAILQSPSRFSAFVFDETLATLPPRVAAKVSP